MPLFSQARLLLVITVHDILTLLKSLYCTTLGSRDPSRSSMIQDVALRLLHVISCAQYGTVSYRLCVVIRKIYIVVFHCTVYCTMRIEGGCHLWRILRCDGGMGDVWHCVQRYWLPPKCQFFLVSALDVNFFTTDIGFKWRIVLERPFLGLEHEEKKSKVFSSTFGEKARLPDRFLRDIDSRNHAINSSR